MNDMSVSFDSDCCVLVPCSGMGRGADEPALSVTGHFDIENAPLRINTLFFVGSKGRLVRYLSDGAGVDLKKDPSFDESFKGICGLTFPCTDEDGAGFVVIWMPKFEWSVTDMETLSHECLHAAVMVMRMSGQRPKIFSSKEEEEVDDEGLAYRQSSMFASILKALARKQQKAYRKAVSAKRRSRCMKS